jgi:chitin disaccharide deacetylase
MTAPARAVRLAVCADDFGLSGGINEAIVDLVGKGRLSAFSCLVDAPAFRPGAARLAPLAGRADIGLHLNFTESFGEHAPRFSLPAVIGRAYARLLAPGAIRAEIRRQLDCFEDACGFAPHHVDGHQHVQQLPVVREALLAELEARYPAARPWLRNGLPPPASGLLSLFAHDRLKPVVLGTLGARALMRDAARRGFATNRHLLGVYDFTGSAADYAARLGRWLAQAGDGDLLMTHPGLGEQAGDPIAAARRREYEVLGGETFAQALAAHGAAVTRLSQIAR